MRRLWCLAAAVCFLFLLPGCSFIDLDMENRMSPPRGAGEQNEVQEALEEYVYSLSGQTDGEASNRYSYVLKYPKMGDDRFAFVFRDVNRDGAQEAMAFYALSPGSGNVHMALLSKESGVWLVVDDIEGLASEIELATFGDLDGDRRPELLAGFSMYNTMDRLLMVYSLTDNTFAQRYTDTYTHIAVGPVTSDRHDDLLLFRLNASEQQTSVRLLSMEGDTMVEKGQAYLDGQIRGFGDATFSRLSESVRGVYQDCAKDNATTITELLLWDGERFSAPLYNPAENITTLSARESGLPCMDINSDGQIEWPLSSRMPGFEMTPTEDVTLWLTEWVQWDTETLSPKTVFTSVMVPTDDYYLKIPSDWQGSVTAEYDRAARKMTIRYVNNGVVGKEILKLRTVPGGSEPADDGDDYIFLASRDTTQYEVWYDSDCPLALSMERLYNLFTLCVIKGG